MRWSLARASTARTLHELPHGARIGTSSLRRRAQLRASAPRSRRAGTARQCGHAASQDRRRARSTRRCWPRPVCAVSGSAIASSRCSIRRTGCRRRDRARSPCRRARTTRRMVRDSRDPRSRGHARRSHREARLAGGAGRRLSGADRRGDAGADRPRPMLHGVIAAVDGTQVVRGSIAVDLARSRRRRPGAGRAAAPSRAASTFWRSLREPHERTGGSDMSTDHAGILGRYAQLRSRCGARMRSAAWCARRGSMRRSSSGRSSCARARESRTPIGSMPGVFQTSVDELLRMPSARATRGIGGDPAVRHPRHERRRPARGVGSARPGRRGRPRGQAGSSRSCS